MQRKEIHINGITTSNTYTEGDAYELVNMRKKNGVLMPVSPRAVTRTLEHDWDQLFIHRNENYEHTIGAKNGQVWWIEGNIKIADTVGDETITQVGNMLNVLDAVGMKHLLWYENTYRLIPSFLEINPKLKVNEKSTPPSPSPIWYHFVNEEATTDGESETQEAQRDRISTNLFYKQRKVLEKKGLLSGFLLACTAIELYDGTYIYSTNPVMLAQPTDRHRRYSGKVITAKDSSIHTMDYYNNPASLMFTNTGGSWNPLSYNEEEKYYEIYSSSFFYYGVPDKTVTLAGNLTDEIQFCAQHILAGGMGGQQDTYSTLTVTGCELMINIPATISAEFEGIIKGISVFITPQVSMYNLDKISKRTEGWFDFGGGLNSIASYNVFPEIKTDEKLIDELINLANFYKVGELSFEEINSNAGTWKTIDLKDKLGDSLYTQETLPVNAGAQHKLLPKNQYVYNSKLHVFDYRLELFKGFPLTNYFPEQGIGQFYAYYSTKGGYIWWTETHIKTQSGISKVVQSEIKESPVLVSDIMPLLSYPDRRAFKMVIYLFTYTSFTGEGANKTYEGSKITYNEFSLKPHPTHNFAYYIRADLKPFPFTQTVFWRTPPPEQNPTEIFPNGLAVSAVNNPIYYPAHDFYTIGTGVIYTMQSNRMNVSDRNFGQYPLYVATSGGWFMLTVGTGDITYTNITPISTGEVPLNKLTCATPYGVVFIGTRGLYLINSEGAQLITDTIEQRRQRFNMEWNIAFDHVLVRHSEDFATYLQGVNRLLYNPFENELISVNPNYPYSYVIDIDDKTAYKSTEPIDYEIQNTYPGMLVVDGLTIKDYSLREQTGAQVSVITRPISFGTRDIKKVDRIYLRALLHNLKKVAGKESLICFWHSEDNVNYHITRAFGLKEANWRDINMGQMSRTKYRWFVLGFGATIDDDSQVISIEANVEKVYNNEKQI